MMIFSAIAAMSENRIIGKNNQLLWHLPADLRHFKSLTTGNTLIMGRKTYQAIGKALPNRINIVVTRDIAFSAAGCLVVHSPETALETALCTNSKEVFIIGGGDIYQTFLPKLQRIYLTIVHHVFEGDTSFPELDANEWKEIECIDHAADRNNPYAYSFITLVRNKI